MKPKNIILGIENIVCLYRNYYFFGKNTQKFIIIRVFIELLLILVSVVLRRRYFDCSMNIQTLFFNLNVLNSIFVIVFTLYHAKTFKKLFNYGLLLLTYVENEKLSFLQKTNERKWVLLFIIVIYNIAHLIPASIHSIKMAEEMKLTGLNAFLYYLYRGLYYVSNFRLFLQFYIISFTIVGLPDQLDCIIQSINTQINKIKQLGNMMVNSIEHTEHIKMFDKWSAAYATVEKVSKLCNVMFSLQIAAMIVMVVVIYIMLMYGIVVLSAEGPWLAKYMYIVTLLEFLVALLMLSLAAQLAMKRARKLRQSLSTLLIHLLDYEMQYKALRDLLRQVDTHPISIKALGIDVDMTLLPTCIALCTTYTVIALQFNNVV